MKKISGMRITERDKEILSFINEFGFCEIVQIQKKFKLKEVRSYQLVKRLIQGGFLQHQQIFHRRHGVYHVTDSGSSHTDLPALGKVSIRHYDHHLRVIEVYIKLMTLYPEVTWITERELLMEQFSKGMKKKAHLADGILLFPGSDKKIAVEVELSRKKKSRIEEIIKKYGADFDTKEVWYYCYPKIIPLLKRLTEKKPFIKIFNIEEFLSGPNERN